MTEIFLGLVAGLGTCLGALLVVLNQRWGQRALALLFGLAAGIMMAVVVLDLLPSALTHGSNYTAIFGFSTGIILLVLLELLLKHRLAPANAGQKYLKMGYMILFGIALHDLPEGLAIAAGFAADSRLGPLITLAIGLHNIPEGMATALPLKLGQLSRRQIITLNALLSLVTPLGTALGLALVHISPAIISWMLAFAAGAMTYIVTGELMPEYRHLGRRPAVQGMLAGFLIIALLTAIF